MSCSVRPDADGSRGAWVQGCLGKKGDAVDYFVSQAVYWLKWVMWHFMLYAQYFVPPMFFVAMLLWLRRERSWLAWLGFAGACWFAGSALLRHSRINIDNMTALRMFLQDGHWSGLALLAVAILLHFWQRR